MKSLPFHLKWRGTFLTVSQVFFSDTRASIIVSVETFYVRRCLPHTLPEVLSHSLDVPRELDLTRGLSMWNRWVDGLRLTSERTSSSGSFVTHPPTVPRPPPLTSVTSLSPLSDSPSIRPLSFRSPGPNDLVSSPDHRVPPTCRPTLFSVIRV